jgi:hypothetical protein
MFGRELIATMIAEDTSARDDGMRYEFMLWYQLYRLEAAYWHDVDCNDGRNAADFYVEDGTFAIGNNQFSGRRKIQEYYAWRERHARGTSRHLIANLQVDAQDERHAKVFGVISFYQGEGRPPVLASKPAVLVADLANECVLGDDRKWRFKSHVLRPVFVGDDVPLSLAFDLNR